MCYHVLLLLYKVKEIDKEFIDRNKLSKKNLR